MTLLLLALACTSAPEARLEPAPPPVVAVAAPVEAPAPAPVEAPPPVYEAHVTPIPDEMRAAMVGVTWREGCPVGLDDLRLVTLKHWNLEGEVVDGQIVVAAHVADAVRDAFAAAFEARFPIARMEPVHLYGGDDDRSMAANNTSAFNCRPVAGTDRWSQHSYGAAIDVNPVHNPFVRGDRVDPPAGRAYLDRSDLRPGMLGEDAALVRALSELGWGWGGRWRSSKDYQHLSASGT